MKRYFALLGLTALWVAPIWAENSNHFDGLYSGVRAGWVLGNANLTFVQSAISVGVLNQQIGISGGANVNTKGSGVGSGYYLGYGFSKQLFYLAVEAFGNLNAVSLNKRYIENSSLNAPYFINTQITSNNKLATNIFEYGVDLRPGAILTPSTLIYGRVGVAVNQLQLDSDNTYSVTSTFGVPATAVTQLSSSASKDVLGLRLGVGAQQYIGQNITVNADYTYTDYGCLSTHAVTSSQNINIPFVIPNGFSNEAKACYTSHAVTLGATYYFN